MPHLISFYERISHPDLLPAITRMTAQFDGLSAGTSSEELSRFVDEFVTTFAPVVRDVSRTSPDLTLAGAPGPLAEFTTDVLNSTQQHALELIGARLDDIN